MLKTLLIYCECIAQQIEHLEHEVSKLEPTSRAKKVKRKLNWVKKLQGSLIKYLKRII